jgi:phage terminase large subunit-like protein
MIDRVTEYAQKVVNQEIISGELHILACQRHLKNLQILTYTWSLHQFLLSGNLKFLY